MQTPNQNNMQHSERILDKAIELFKAYGIRAVTMDQISAELGVSKRTIYELFKDKNDLVMQSVKEMVKKDNQESLEIISKSSNVIEALYLIGQQGRKKRSEFNPLFMQDIRRSYSEVQSLFTSGKLIRFDSVTYTILKKGVNEGIFRKELDIDIVNDFLHEIMNIYHNKKVIKNQASPVEGVMRNVFLPYLRGISTEKGLDLIEKYFSHLKI